MAVLPSPVPGSMIWGFPGHGYGTERSRKGGLCGQGEPVTSWKAFSSRCSLGTWSCGGECGHGRSVVQPGLSATSAEHTKARAGARGPAPSTHIGLLTISSPPHPPATPSPPRE